MAASDPDRPKHSASGTVERPTEASTARCLSEPALRQRIDEEVARAIRFGTPLSCLLVGIEDLQEIAQAHGEGLSQRTLAYASEALGHDLRRFDRIGLVGPGGLLVVLPGADGPRGEIVARRALSRLRAIKIEAAGTRRALRISVGIAAWHEGQTAEQLLARTRATTPDERLGFADALRI